MESAAGTEKEIQEKEGENKVNVERQKVGNGYDGGGSAKKWEREARESTWWLAREGIDGEEVCARVYTI